MYEDQTYEVIKERVLSDINNGLDKREGSFTNDMISAFARQQAIMYTILDDILSRGFLLTNYDQDLEARCAESGIYRKQGQSSSGELKIVGTKGLVIPNATLFRCGDFLYQMLNDVVIGESDDICYVESIEVGDKYNVEAGSIFKIVGDFDGVDDILCEKNFEGGLDIETDEALRRRYFEKKELNETSGNVAHYKTWAMEVNGVDRATVYPRWDGNGTVKVVIVGKDNTPCTQEVIQACEDYINEVKPLSEMVLTVSTPRLLNVVVSADVEIDENYTLEEVENDFTNSLKEYIKTISTELVYAKVFGLLVNTLGVLDVNSLTLNESNSNITTNEDLIINIQSVEVSEVI